MDGRRVIDYSGIRDGEASLARQIVEYVERRPNTNTTKKHIEKWFFGTTSAFIDTAIKRCPLGWPVAYHQD